MYLYRRRAPLLKIYAYPTIMYLREIDTVGFMLLLSIPRYSNCLQCHYRENGWNRSIKCLYRWHYKRNVNFTTMSVLGSLTYWKMTVASDISIWNLSVDGNLAQYTWRCVGNNYMAKSLLLLGFRNNMEKLMYLTWKFPYYCIQYNGQLSIMAMHVDNEITFEDCVNTFSN